MGNEARRRVRKAVLPAAGFGTRFLPATKAVPKELMPVVDRPAIEYVIEEAVRAGLDDVLLVTSRNKQAIEDHFDRHLELEQTLRERGNHEALASIDVERFGSIHSVRQSEALGLGHAVLQARDHVGDQSFAVLLPDHLLPPEDTLLRRMIELHEQTGRAVISVARVPREEVSLYGIIEGRPSEREGVHEVTRMVEKPSPEDAPSDLAIIARYVLPPETFDLIAATEPGAGGEIQLTDALQALADRAPILAVEHEGTHHDIGDQLGLLKATVSMAAERADLGDEFLEWLATFVRERKEP